MQAAESGEGQMLAPPIKEEGGRLSESAYGIILVKVSWEGFGHFRAYIKPEA